mmetsp:Transcript_66850/g.211551  ORF Transcript_66850/g.211551 Transcript_66850/m.211551 type:complete len:331 (-) Transcript_66850:217-1209(-)
MRGPLRSQQPPPPPPRRPRPIQHPRPPRQPFPPRTMLGPRMPRLRPLRPLWSPLRRLGPWPATRARPARSLRCHCSRPLPRPAYPLQPRAPRTTRRQPLGPGRARATQLPWQQSLRQRPRRQRFAARFRALLLAGGSLPPPQPARTPQQPPMPLQLLPSFEPPRSLGRRSTRGPLGQQKPRPRMPHPAAPSQPAGPAARPPPPLAPRGFPPHPPTREPAPRRPPCALPPRRRWHSERNPSPPPGHLARRRQPPPGQPPPPVQRPPRPPPPPRSGWGWPRLPLGAPSPALTCMPRPPPPAGALWPPPARGHSLRGPRARPQRWRWPRPPGP